MEKRLLEDCLAKRMSLQAIGEQVGRHPSTVGYWLKKHGLSATGKVRHSPNDAVDPDRVPSLVEEGLYQANGCGVRGWLFDHALLGSTAGLGDRSSGASEGGRTCKGSRASQGIHKVPQAWSRRFFARREGGFRRSKCNTVAVSERRREVKRRLVQEAGGCCRICGFAEHPSALQFHHVDSAAKEFHLGHQGVTRSIARMRAEAEKCVLLCANCHALVEAGVMNVSGVDR
jgi:hypothetical protein